MAILTPVSQSARKVIGNLVTRFYTMSGNNGDTWVPPQPGIEIVVPVPTTAISVGYTLASGVVTFVTSGAWAARVMVISREG